MKTIKIPECTIYAQTDIGLRRKNNEDCAYCGKSQYGVMLAVADGMGGYRKGEVASQMVIDYSSYAFESLKKTIKLSRCKKIVLPYMTAVNRRIFNMAQTPDFEKMATTTTLALVGIDGTYIFASGDSRAYVYKKDKYLKQVTKDQNFYQYLLERGKTKEAEALSEDRKNALYTGIGVISFLDDYEEICVKNYDYDTLLLCTDGLYNMATDYEIEGVIKDDTLNTAEKCKKLIQIAINNGGLDNVGVVLMEKKE